MAAQCLMAFVAQDDSDDAYAGAIYVAEWMHIVRQFLSKKK